MHLVVVDGDYTRRILVEPQHISAFWFGLRAKTDSVYPLRRIRTERDALRGTISPHDAGTDGPLEGLSDDFDLGAELLQRARNGQTCLPPAGA